MGQSLHRRTFLRAIQRLLLSTILLKGRHLTTRSPFPNLRSWLALIRSDGVQHDLIRRLWRVDRVSFAPIVTDRIRENVAISVKIRAANRAADLRVSLEAVFGVLVPEVEGAVAARGAEGAVLRVEADRVDAEDVAGVAVVGRCLAVAFKTEVGAGVLVLDVLDRAPPFDAANRESAGVRKAGDYARLPLEWGLHGLVEVRGFVERKNIDVSVCRPDDE